MTAKRSASWKPRQISKKLPTGAQISSGPGVLNQRPILAQKIAANIACWSAIERRICEIAAYLVDSDNWTASQMLAHIWKFRVRSGLLESMALKKCGVETSALIKAKLKKALMLSDERDGLAHGHFQAISIYPDALIKVTGWDKDEQWWLYDGPVLDSLFDQLFAAYNDVGDALFAIAAQVQARQFAEGRRAFRGQYHIAGIVPGRLPNRDAK